ncbi:DUF3244 domain-containing protein [Limibacter armeniacum]|uniref:DUF3244 domain-containing protein n=1 Tax=Limibacter armeniacum TaxID=466084 RepID=UPI002FE52D0C
MNRMIKTMAMLILAVSAMLSANAAEFRPLGGIVYSFTVTSDSKEAKLILKDMKGESADFMLLNKNDEVVMFRKFEGVLETSSKLDFSTLAAGQYLMVLQFEDNRVERALEITPNGTLVVMDYRMTSKDMPFHFKYSDQELDIFFNKSAEKVLNILIKDEFGRTMYQSKFVQGFKPIKRFDLSNLKKGIYYLHITGQNTDITETISL